MTYQLSYPLLAAPESFGHSGRTGNQLFQIAATIGLAQRYGAEPRFPDDWPYRHIFRIPDEWYWPREDLDDLDRADELPDVDHLGHYREYLQDVSFWSDPDSYWQVTESIWPTMKAHEQACDELYAQGFDADAETGLCVHIRRGDNITNDPGTINLITDQFYLRAIAEFYSSDVEIAFFTDDPDYVEPNFGHLGEVFRGVPRSKEKTPDYHTEEVLDWIDLVAMSQFDGHILSNSSFAWWGAWLRHGFQPYIPEQIVYPSYWFGPKLIEAGAKPELLFPPTWQCFDAGPIEEQGVRNAHPLG